MYQIWTLGPVNVKSIDSLHIKKKKYIYIYIYECGYRKTRRPFNPVLDCHKSWKKQNHFIIKYFFFFFLGYSNINNFSNIVFILFKKTITKLATKLVVI